MEPFKKSSEGKRQLFSAESKVRCSIRASATAYAARVSRHLRCRHSSVKDMRPTESGSDAATSISFRIATRFSFGLRNAVGALSKGTALFQATPAGYHPLVEGAPQPSALSQQAETRRQRRLPQEGEKDPHSSVLVKMKKRIEGEKGSNSLGFLVATEAGLSTGRGISHAQELGSVFIGVGEEVYPGMIVGLNNKPSNLPVSRCASRGLHSQTHTKKNKQTNKQTDTYGSSDLPLTKGRKPSLHCTDARMRICLADQRVQSQETDQRALSRERDNGTPRTSSASHARRSDGNDWSKELSAQSGSYWHSL